MHCARMMYCIACLGLCVIALAPMAPAQPSVTISPAMAMANPGGTVTVDVWANNISSAHLLHAANISVAFDPAVVSLTSTAVGPFMSSAGGQVYFSTLPTASTVQVNMAILGASSDVSGSGILFSMTFTGVANGTSAITLTGVDLREFVPPDGQAVIAATSQGGSVRVGPTAANLKVFLQGPYALDSMRTVVARSGLVPLAQPYNVAPWDYTGTETVVSLPDSVVDWMLVELRTGTGSDTRVARRAAFLRRDGRLADLDGDSPVTFAASVTRGDYYVVLRHRNHLAVMSAAAVPLTVVSALYDFTTGPEQYYGGEAAALTGGKYGLIAGDADASGGVAAEDRNLTWSNRNQTGYLLSDVDLTGDVGATDRNLTWTNRNKTTEVR